MVLLGCVPKGRLIEQHDIFFGIGRSVADLAPEMKAFWPDGIQLHVDSFREVTSANGYKIDIVPKGENLDSEEKLFFINLGGYKAGDLEEYHYKTVVAAKTMGEAVKISKKSAFYKHYGFKGAESHIDDKYGIDIDDMHKVEDILATTYRERYSIRITPAEEGLPEDEMYIGYLLLGKKPKN
ncbi:MAG: DUF1543 domain-containing protein [Chryseobacterium sp.]|nr:MAG: DUF1543 domain-containing protein [Chryseobacterium sp.]